MKMFDEIEEKHRTTPVVSADGAFQGGGTLILAGGNSEAILQCNETLRSEADSEGLFDLHLRAPNGRPILLHNALLTRSTQHGFYTSGNYEEHVYPNTVVLGSDALVDGNKVARISFTFKDLGLFLYYRHVESHSLWEAPADLLAALKKLRRKDQRQDRFKPTNLFLAHAFPRAVNFRVGPRRYEIGIGSLRSGFEWDAINYRTLPIASISFDSPVTIDDALDAAWQWKQYFSTVALRPFPWTSLTATTGRGRSVKEADFYIPSQEGYAFDDKGPFSLWAGDIPLNRWNERGDLSVVMGQWLRKQNERQRLRGAIANVSKDMTRRVSMDDVVTLCAGIESLEELATPSHFTTADIGILADGAIAAAKKNGVSVDPQRVRTVIGFLRNQSLPQRLRLLMGRLTPFVSEAQARLLISSVLELRTVAAHGVPPSAAINPKMAPTIEGLACACALYDLVTCGLPTRSASDQRIGVLNHLHSTIFELETIKGLATAAKPIATKPATKGSVRPT